MSKKNKDKSSEKITLRKLISKRTHDFQVTFATATEEMIAYFEETLTDIAKLTIEAVQSRESPKPMIAVPGKSNLLHKRKSVPLKMITDIKYPKEGGIEIYYQDCKYPKKAFPYPEVVAGVAIVKRLAVQSIKYILTHKWVIPVVFVLRKSLKEEFADYSHSMLKALYIKPNLFCRSVREIYRVGMKHAKDFMEQRIVWFICMVWEYDDAYRDRFQDIVGEFDPVAFQENPRKELMRILQLGYEREMNPRIKPKWKQVRKIVRFIPLKRLITIINDMDIEKIKPDEIDSYWILIRGDYNSKGRTVEERLAIRTKIDREYLESQEQSKSPQH